MRKKYLAVGVACAIALLLSGCASQHIASDKGHWQVKDEAYKGESEKKQSNNRSEADLRTLF